MAGVASNLCGSFLRPPNPARSPRLSGLRLRTRPYKLGRLNSHNEPRPVDSPSTDERLGESRLGTDNTSPEGTVSTGTEPNFFPTKDINRRVAAASSLAAVGLFLSTRLEFGVSLKDLAAASVPFEKALSNGMPTVVEFYADWCEVCRELAPDWEQELDEFGVEGIPHFAFLDKDGNEEGNIVGRLPRQFFLENVVALANGEASIPHTRFVGQFSSAESRKTHQATSHGIDRRV
ncbi:hypothetical protein QJS10_CPB17g02565 [Acorus calamus]|uniref:Thioredoxin domain-containing protein n=1 Tax=Acorus calamus TaxID=4465 RepID=A0AAV9CTX4_ACOCL|nr:hypothetical protein QJS10_CPB17g02565 [Acorus calamus]